MKRARRTTGAQEPATQRVLPSPVQSRPVHRAGQADDVGGVGGVRPELCDPDGHQTALAVAEDRDRPETW